MKKILLVGEHPYSTTGNGNMMRAILDRLDGKKFTASVYSCTKADIPAFESVPYQIVGTGGATEGDEFGSQELLQTIARTEFDVMLMVGIDLWRFASVWTHLNRLRRTKRFIWGAIFPYDLHMIREDWLRWVNSLDFPCVYSEYGYELLRPRAPKIRYYRPPLNGAELFRHVGIEEKNRFRQKLFHTLPNDAVLAGFVGPNQFRKDPQRMLKAFFQAKEEMPNLYLYMHTRFTKGVFNLQQAAFDYGAGVGDLIIMNQKSSYTRDAMPEIYSAMDMYINTSMQEGLSWTVLEAQLCGIPCIVSDSTAHKELVSNGAGVAVECSELGYIPLVSERGPTWIESKTCTVHGIKNALLELASKPSLRQDMGLEGLKRAKEWLEGISDVNVLLDEMTQEKFRAKIPKILFVQHSSAGDVLMSTQCFKGIKERHEGVPLVYMTQGMYRDIVEDNPYLDEIIEFDENVITDYEVVYNPHGDRILPGGFNNLDVKLHSMYPYFCKIDPDDIFIEPAKPDYELPDEYIVAHTTGGSHQYRGYKHMDMALTNIGYPVVQVGGQDDIVCREADLDLRGKLTWRQTAWVMKNAKCAVVIDSYPSHLAGALGTPVVVLYGPAPARVTGPRGDESKIINLEPNKLDVCPNLTNCWGDPAGKQCKSPCINTLSPMKVRKAVKQLLQREEEKNDTPDEMPQ